MPQEKKVKEASVFASHDLGDHKVVAAMSYVWVLFLIPLLTKRHDPFCQFHAKQGLVLFLVEVVGMFFYWFPLLGQLLFLALVIMSVIGVIRALSGEYWQMPILGQYAKKINL